jgi:hypothetical protein
VALRPDVAVRGDPAIVCAAISNLHFGSSVLGVLALVFGGIEGIGPYVRRRGAPR